MAVNIEAASEIKAVERLVNFDWDTRKRPVKVTFIMECSSQMVLRQAEKHISLRILQGVH